MRKNDQSIYLWSFFIVSAIVLAFLYTPLGGNLSNSPDGYYIETAPSVNFGGRISNSPKRRAANNSYSPGANDVPQAVSSSNYMSQRPVVTGGANQNSNAMAGNSYSASGIGLGASAGTGGGGASGGGGTGMMAVSGGGRSQSTGSAGGGGGGMLAPFSSGVETSNNTMQKFPGGVNGADPGDDDDLGAPIPIGDGSLLLLLFAAVYIFIKNKAKL